MSLSEYNNYSDFKTSSKQSKPLFSIYKIFEENPTRTKTLREDIDEYIDFLDHPNHYKNKKEVGLKCSAILNASNLPPNKSQYSHTVIDKQQNTAGLSNSNGVYKHVVPRLRCKNRFSSCFDNNDFFDLSSNSYTTDNNDALDMASSAKHRIDSSEKAWSPDYVNDFSINRSPFSQNSICENPILRPQFKDKLIDSPKTKKSEKAFSNSTSSTNSFQKQQLAIKACQPTMRSVWQNKFEIWFSHLKQTRNQKSKPKKPSKKKEIQRFRSSKHVLKDHNEIVIINNIYQESVNFDNLLIPENYSKFFIPNNNKYFYDNAMLNTNAYNTRHLILKETAFDRALINFHHGHFTYTGLFSPTECSTCLTFIRDNNLQHALKNSNYLKHYLRNNKSFEAFENIRNTKLKKRLSISEFWSGIKRELSFKLPKVDSRSMNTIGSLVENGEVNKQSKKLAKGYICKKKDVGTIYKKEPLYKTENFYYAISQEFINYFKILGYILIEYRSCIYPVFKTGESELHYTEMKLSLANEAFFGLFMSWNDWYWRGHKDIKKIHSKPVTCYICFHEIGDNMENILFRYKLNYFKDRLCLNCKEKRLLLLVKLAEFDCESLLSRSFCKEALVDSRLSN